jgi:two-component system, repressor protein LuxO
MGDKQVPTRPKILIVEDSMALGETYRAILQADACSISLATRVSEAIAEIDSNCPHVLLVDVNLPDGNGLDIMRQVRQRELPIIVVMMTAQGSVQLAIDAMREGAFDFLLKPFSPDRLRVTIRNAIERRAMASEIEEIRESFGRDRFAQFIGSSLAMQATYRIIQAAAPSNATVFVTGESGTGKELCADALHRFSKRAKGPFIAVNCAAIPRDMLESELFGHTKGAFTGAVADRKGAVLSAQGGTLFLDEICEMDLALQTKLLRFLQTMTVQRLGEDQVRQADVRIVCATNKDPRAEVAAGRLREDLFYRLHVLPVEMPPLRDRGDDVLLIARAFLERFAAEEGKTCSSFSAEVEAAIIRFAWPGNVRQLQNLIRNLVVFSQGTVIELAELPAELRPKTGERLLGRVTLPSALPSHAPAGTEDGERRPLVSLDEAIRHHVEAAIAMCGGSIPRAAAMLEVAPSTIYRRIEAWQAADALQPAT